MLAIRAYRKFLEKCSLPTPSYHVVLGSGFGQALDKISWEQAGELSFSELPGFPAATIQDHAGKYRFYRRGEHSICFQMGRLHGYEGHQASSVVQTVMLPRLAGVKNFLLTNAAGGLSLSMRAGDVMLIRDHVNLTGQNPLAGKNPSGEKGEALGPRFPDLSRLYDRDWRARLQPHLAKAGLAVHEGVYLGLLGPSFETPAEVQLFASWGLQAVGMSTVWEAIALGHSGARVAGLSLVSNLASGLVEGTLDHESILAVGRASAERILLGVAAAIEEELGAL